MGDMMNSLVVTVCLLASLTNAFQEVSSPEYIALTAAEKSEIIWSNVLEDLTPADWFGILDLPGIFTESMCPTLRAPGDEPPWEEGIISDGTRYKYIHTVGAVGQVQWDSSSSGTEWTLLTSWPCTQSTDRNRGISSKTTSPTTSDPAVSTWSRWKSSSPRRLTIFLSVVSPTGPATERTVS